MDFSILLLHLNIRCNMLSTGIIKATIEQASYSTYKVHIGAVIFRKKAILGSGFNQIRSSQISFKHKVWNNSLHAEQHAVFSVKDWSKLKGCSILVLKVSKTLGLLSNALPCEMCLSLLNHVGIKNIYYSDEHGQIVKYTGVAQSG